jgi:hypothetical protein
MKSNIQMDKTEIETFYSRMKAVSLKLVLGPKLLLWSS